jgi:hypothetical protein
MGIEDLTVDDVLDALAEAIAPPIEPPPGAFTYEDVSEKYGITRGVAKNWISMLIKDGKVERLPLWKGRAYFVMVKNDNNSGS